MKTLALLLGGAVALIASIAPAQDTRIVVDDLGRTVEVPLNPQRIISGDDNTLGMPLADFGVDFIGAQARVAEDGSYFMRGLDVNYGISFAESGIEPVSVWWEFDLEKVALLDPDLIILIEWQQEQAELFEQIAPTFFVFETPEPWAVQQAIARATGKEDVFEYRRGIYEDRVATLKASLDIPEGTTYSLIGPGDGTFWASTGAYNFTLVLRDLGFVPSPGTQALIDAGSTWGEEISAERLQDFDADYIFISYQSQPGRTPSEVLTNMDGVLPGWCDFVTACQNGNVILYPWETIGAPTFAAANAGMDIIATHFASKLLRAQ
ncbi:ABC transporter substrate-binding protein [Cognatiyoonia sp. IB215182]|uniref:ABC transporter substrate-binding protein n=1 Tax=Cognatiyoonia sp. IB215182 TaxID=3097353 RepID=UPI002A1595A0|nr:ABC transporter substrate-binding protein [Cognatiyoonia sp. IB215182]MDX8354777.1 ABC transporter substrate-binding protein [Cognatiyoonia sp. IB215182]